MSGGPTHSGELVATMRVHHDAGRTEEPLALARSAWDVRPAGETVDNDDLAELGEVWRLAMLAASRSGALSTERLVWRARALSAFVRSGDRNGAALLLLPTYFDAVSEGAPPAELLAILESMRLLASDGGPTPRSTVLSSCLEKEGYYLTLEAEALPPADSDGRASAFAVASQRYEEALAAETSARRRFKIRAAQTTTAYLAATDSEQRDIAADALRDILTELERDGITAGDVAAIGRENLERMAQQRRDLLPYEIT